MEYIEKIVSTQESMFCPSTGEVMFSPDMKYINSNADAFIGCWSRVRMNKPSIKDEKLKDAWKIYYKQNLKKGKAAWEEYQRFFKEYENPQWIAYECKFIMVAYVTFKFTDIYVVKADTIIESVAEQHDPKIIKLNTD